MGMKPRKLPNRTIREPDHNWEVLYPRGTWPAYRCQDCSRLVVPTAEELKNSDPPDWWFESCMYSS